MVDLSEFKVSNYPDGHKHIKSDKDLKGDTELSASIRTFDDLFLIAQIKRIHPELTTLAIKYLLAGRCDRRFSPGEALDLAIVCNFINGLGFERVYVLKPHSVATLDHLDHGFDWDVTPNLIRMAQEDIGEAKVCYVSPDAGAAKWIEKYKLSPLIQGSKKRDTNGAVAGVELQHLEQMLNYQNFVIVDDLCDGGGTFIAIAKEIHLHSPQAKVYLVVTHAIFSKGFEPFAGHIERVYCTDSFATFTNPLVKQFKLS
jgi:ribose-phosphate pyrophosphokinase